MATPNPFQIFVRQFERLGIPYMVSGSVAMIVYGEPRLTLDVDIIASLTLEDIPRIVGAFPLSEFYCPPEEVIRIEKGRSRRGHFNIIHHESGFKADVYLHGADPLHDWGLANVRRVEVDGGIMTIAPPAYVIVRKLEFYREGGSDKHVRDIRSMLANLEADQLADVERIVIERGLADVWGVVRSPT